MTEILKKRTDIEREVQGETSRIHVEIASKVYDAMDVQGISKEELAKLVGITPEYLSQLLDGEFPITIKMMVRLATTLGFKWDLGILAATEASTRNPKVASDVKIGKEKKKKEVKFPCIGPETYLGSFGR